MERRLQSLGSIGKTMVKTLLKELQFLFERKNRFTYDVRSGCQVYNGVVAKYRVPSGDGHFVDLELALKHSLAHDGILGCWKDPDSGTIRFDSCRIFTDLENASRFARLQEQHVVHNLTRDLEWKVQPVNS